MRYTSQTVGPDYSCLIYSGETVEVGKTEMTANNIREREGFCEKKVVYCKLISVISDSEYRISSQGYLCLVFVGLWETMMWRPSVLFAPTRMAMQSNA